MIKNQTTNSILFDYKKNYILDQLISMGISHTQNGTSIFALNYKQLVRELALAKTTKE